MHAFVSNSNKDTNFWEVFFESQWIDSNCKLQQFSSVGSRNCCCLQTKEIKYHFQIDLTKRCSLTWLTAAHPTSRWLTIWAHLCWRQTWQRKYTGTLTLEFIETQKSSWSWCWSLRSYNTRYVEKNVKMMVVLSNNKNSSDVDSDEVWERRALSGWVWLGLISRGEVVSCVFVSLPRAWPSSDAKLILTSVSYRWLFPTKILQTWLDWFQYFWPESCSRCRFSTNISNCHSD